MIHCCSGTGGLFLTSVVAQILGYNIYSNFSNTGHAHDMGRGNWKGAPGLCIVGVDWQTNYRAHNPLYYTHVVPADFQRLNPDITVIMIKANPEDYEKVAELLVHKVSPDVWTKEEYDKWAGPDYPPYSPNNIAESELIRNDLINDIKITNVKKWHDENLNMTDCTTINFRTVMGIDRVDLVDTICNIVKLPATDAIRQYVAEYQKINQSLYFKNYAR